MTKRRHATFAGAAVLLLLGGFASAARAQDAPTPSGECACGDLLEAMIEKVETNYPGYALEVRGTDLEAEYRGHLERMRADASAAAPGIPCVRVLQEYVAHFRDGHLFVGGRARLSGEDSTLLKAEAPRIVRTANQVLRDLEARAGSLDPAEGIWADPAGLKIAIVPRPAELGAAGGLIGIVLESSVEGWSPGDVKAELKPLADGSYDVILYDDARAPTRPHVYKRGLSGSGALQRDGLLLHMPPTTWGKLHPVRPGQEGWIDPVDPRAPTARLAGPDAVVFHVPSNVPSHASRLRGLVDQYRGAIERAGLLVIDVRGNEGGSAFVTNVFMPYLVTPEKRPPRYLAEGASAVLSSPDNVDYFGRMSWAPEGLVARLQANPGELVPYLDAPDETEAPADTATARPSRVAILTDGMTVSAAEAFVLKAMRNGKVTLYGQPTGGVIDYQTVGIVRFGCPEAGLYVGYPTIVGSDRLPEGGVRATGIVPDVPIDPAEPDPVGWILERHREAGGSSGS